MGESIKASQGYDFERSPDIFRAEEQGQLVIKYNSFNLLCNTFLYRIFPIQAFYLQKL